MLIGTDQIIAITTSSGNEYRLINLEICLLYENDIAIIFTSALHRLRLLRALA
jgi:hypothetical protein